MLPEGTYRGRGAKPLLRTQSHAGDDRLIVTLRVTVGPHEGQQIDWRGMIKGGATPITLDALALLGYDGEHDESVTRNEVEFVVEHEHYDGKQRANVKYINDPAKTPGYTELSPAEELAAKARIKAAFLAHKTARASSQAPRENDPKF